MNTNRIYKKLAIIKDEKGDLFGDCDAGIFITDTGDNIPSLINSGGLLYISDGDFYLSTNKGKYKLNSSAFSDDNICLGKRCLSLSKDVKNICIGEDIIDNNISGIVSSNIVIGHKILEDMSGPISSNIIIGNNNSNKCEINTFSNLILGNDNLSSVTGGIMVDNNILLGNNNCTSSRGSIHGNIIVGDSNMEYSLISDSILFGSSINGKSVNNKIVGNRITITGSNSFILGEDSKIIGENNIILSCNNQEYSSNNSILCGNVGVKKSESTVCVGRNSLHERDKAISSVILGYMAGSESESSSKDSFVNNSVIIGRESGYSDGGNIESSVLIGNKCSLYNKGLEKSVIIGCNTNLGSYGKGNIVIGYGSNFKSTGDNNIIIGNDIVSQSSDSFIIGTGDKIILSGNIRNGSLRIGGRELPKGNNYLYFTNSKEAPKVENGNDGALYVKGGRLFFNSNGYNNDLTVPYRATKYIENSSLNLFSFMCEDSIDIGYRIRIIGVPSKCGDFFEGIFQLKYSNGKIECVKGSSTVKYTDGDKLIVTSLKPFVGAIYLEVYSSNNYPTFKVE